MTIQTNYDLMAAINSLNRLICYKKLRKYKACCVASSFNYLIVLKQKMLILLEFVTKNDVFENLDNNTEFLMNKSLQVECHLKQRKLNIKRVVLHFGLIV